MNAPYSTSPNGCGQAAQPLRNSHGRERYVGAVTLRLTERRASDAITGKPLESLPGA
jgi:hypothetical protein